MFDTTSLHNVLRLALAAVALAWAQAAFASAPCAAADRAHDVLFVDADIPATRQAFERFTTLLGDIRLPAGQCVRTNAFFAHVEAECTDNSPKDAICIDHDLAAYHGPEPEIVTAGSEIVAHAEARRFPHASILFVVWMDPVAEGLIERLSAPGGQMTGVWATATVTSKQVELLHLGFPAVRRIAVIADVDSETPETVARFRDEAKSAYGIELDYLFAQNLETLRKGIRDRAAPIDAWIVNYGVLAFDDPDGLMRTIGDRPVATDQVGLLDAGALFAYLTKPESVVKIWSDMARLILGGTPVGAIPVHRPRFFKLVLNADKARSMRLSPPFLRRVTDVQRQ